MKYYIAVAIAFFLTYTSIFSQPKTVDIIDADVTHSHVLEDGIMYASITYRGTFFWYLPHSATVPSVKYIQTDLKYSSNLHYTDNGAYYIGYSKDAGINVVYIGVNNSMATYQSSLNMSSNVNEHIAAVMDGNMYVVDSTDATYRVWQVDGEAKNIELAFESLDKIAAMRSVNDSLLIITKSSSSLGFYKLPINGAAVKFADLPIATAVNPKIIGEYDQFAYIDVTSSAGKSSVFRCDFQAVELFVDDLDASSIWFEGDRYVATNGDLYITGKLINPAVFDTVEIAAELQSRSSTIVKRISDKYYVFGSHEYGHEIAFINENNEFELVADLAPGIASGLSFRPEGTYLYHYQSLEDPYSQQGDTLYAIMTNGQDAHQYLYSLVDREFQSVFSLENTSQHGYLNVIDGYAYWVSGYWYSDNVVQRHKISDTGAAQPMTKEVVDGQWYKQINLVELDKFYNFIDIYPMGVKIDKDGAVISTWTSPYYDRPLGVMTEEMDSVLLMVGATTCIKVDAQGKLLWIKNMGSLSKSSYVSSYNFIIDNNSDVIISDIYIDKGIYGRDTFDTGYKVNTLAKLDGRNGDLLWVKELANNQVSTSINLENEKIAVDKDNNIYVSFKHTPRLQEFPEQEDRFVESFSALAKYSSDGNLIFVKKMPLGRGSSYSEYFIMAEVDTIQNRLITLRDNSNNGHIQVFDLAGNLLDSLSNFTDSEITTGTLNADQDMVAAGLGKGSLRLGPYTDEYTANEKPPRRSFNFVYNGQLNGISHVNTSESYEFQPIDIASNSSFVYVLGTGTDYELLVVRLNQLGEYLGHKYLNQTVDLRDTRIELLHLEVSDNSMVVVTPYVQYSSSLGIVPLANHSPSISIVHLPLSGFDYDINGLFFRSLSIFKDRPDARVIVYPNPFVDYVRVLHDRDREDFYWYELFDMTGKIIKRGSLPVDAVKDIYIGDVATGMYILSFYDENSEKVYSKKLIKMK